MDFHGQGKGKRRPAQGRKDETLVGEARNIFG